MPHSKHTINVIIVIHKLIKMKPLGTSTVDRVNSPRIQYFMDLKVVFVNSALRRHSLTTSLT